MLAAAALCKLGLCYISTHECHLCKARHARAMHLHPWLLMQVRNVELLAGRMWQKLVVLLHNFMNSLQIQQALECCLISYPA